MLAQHDDAIHRGRPAHNAHILLDHRLQFRVGRVGTRHDFRLRLQEHRHRALVELVQQVALVRHIVVDAGFGQPQLLCDFIHCAGVVAFFGEHARRAVENLLTARFLSFGSSCHRRVASLPKPQYTPGCPRFLQVRQRCRCASRFRAARSRRAGTLRCRPPRRLRAPWCAPPS
jgi:hypothetical protein